MKKLKRRLSKAFNGGRAAVEEGAAEGQIGTTEPQQQKQQQQPLHHEPNVRQLSAVASFASSSSQFFPGSSVLVDPSSFGPYKYLPTNNFADWNFNRRNYRWSLSDSLSHMNERLGAMTVEEEEGVAARHIANGAKADKTAWMGAGGDKETEIQNAPPMSSTDFKVPLVVMRAKKPQQQRQFHSKIKSWHAPRWFGNAVHAASASLSLSGSSNNVPKLGSDGESVAEMSSPSTSGEAAALTSTAGASNAMPPQQTEYVPNVRLRNKKKKTAPAVNNARKRLSEQEIQKRLSLPAYINIPPTVLDRLSRVPTLEDIQLSRKSRRTSLSEIGFGKMETYRKILGLGEGTYANVFLGQSLLTGRSVALKEIRLEHEEGAPCTAIREVSLLRSLKHCNIVTLHDVVHTDNVLTLVFEFVQKDLREYMEQLEQRICIPNVRLFLVQLLRGLSYCHSRRILHRDLKPQNLLISKSGELKLADFGLARAQSIPTKSYSSEVVTLWYRPPDVLLGSTEYSSHIDMWGVGCIFYEMLAQKPMFAGSKVEEQLDLIYRKLGTPTPQLHPELCALAGYKRCAHQFRHQPPRGLIYLPGRITQERADLLQKLVAYEGRSRISAAEAMRHHFLKCFPEALFELADNQSVLSLPGVNFYTEKTVDDLENKEAQQKLTT